MAISNTIEAAVLVSMLCLPASARPQPTQEDYDRRKWEEAGGYALSLGATVGGVAAGALLAASGAEEVGATMVLSGLLLGPSAGQFQAGSWMQGLAGSGVRLVGAGFFMAALNGAVGAAFCEAFGGLDGGTGEEGDRDEPCGSPGPGLALAAMAFYGGGALYSLVDTHFAFTRKWRRRWGSALILDPVPGGRGIRSGVVAYVRF